jgi:hypothetical protein
MKKYSSGFHEGNDSSSMKKCRQKNGESSNSSDFYHRQNHGPKYRLPTPPPAPSLSPFKRNEQNNEIVEIKSDLEEDISHNNNEEALPDRHRKQESVDTGKREDSNSSDVIFVGDSTEEIEKLSWITSDGEN